MPVRPSDPSRFSEQMPERVTIVVDRDSGRGLEEAVTEATTFGDLSVDAARRAIREGIRDVRSGDVVTVLGVRVAVR